MTRSTLTRLTASLAFVAVTALLASCAGPAEPPTPSDSPSATSAPPPQVSPSPQPTVSAEPTCDTIIPQATVADFESLGWSSQADVFRIGPSEFPNGILCTWGDLKVASDHVQMFGWAPISSDDAIAQRDALLQEGWVREDGPDGVYLSEDPEFAIAVDSEGYGLTYVFGDGWVKFADTKQGTLLIEWPPAS